jgi:putative NADH-flavin reductase
MKVFLLGATGNTGYEVLRRLLSEKHTVSALVRNPARLSVSELSAEPTQLTVVEGSVGEGDNLVSHMSGCKAVISVLGTGLQNVNTDIYSEGGRNILKAMRANGIMKLITMTSASIDLTDPATDTFLMNRIIRPNYNKVYYDQTRWETILDETKDIDWICVRAPKLISGPLTGTYRVNLSHSPRGGWKISHADLAEFIVNQLSSDKYSRCKPVVAY